MLRKIGILLGVMAVGLTAIHGDAVARGGGGNSAVPIWAAGAFFVFRA